MVIRDVITNKELDRRLTSLRKSNWKVGSMASGLTGSAKEIIDNWFSASRPMLLKMLGLEEDQDYRYVYHELKKED